MTRDLLKLTTTRNLDYLINCWILLHTNAHPFKI